MGLANTMSLRHMSPVKLAVVLSILLVLWMAFGERKSALDSPPPATVKQGQQLPRVEVRWSEASPRSNQVIAQGQVQPWSQVTVKAQVAGRVATILKQQGDSVQQGETLLQLSDEGRSEILSQAQANSQYRQSELNSALALEKSRFVPETDISRLKSELAQAKAQLAAAQLAVAYSRPTAPFNGVVARRYIEPGELVASGTALMDVVVVDKLKITAQIPQQSVSQLAVGQTAHLELLDNRVLSGSVLFISPAAESQTRSFYIEVAAENPQRWRIAGSSVTLRIDLPALSAHEVSPALLSLNADGQLGVHAVDEHHKVVFYPVRIASVNSHGAIVQGLPERVRMITMGAGFVHPGQTVDPVEAAQ